MQLSNPTLLVGKTLSRVWRRKATGLIAGKPHMLALLLPMIIGYGFFAWQARQFLTPLAGIITEGSEQANFTVLVSGLIFAVMTSATWFLARQTLEVSVPPNLQALPFTPQTWLRAQSILFVLAIWVLNSFLTLPLFVALGRQQGMALGPWIIFVELVSLFYVLIGLLLYLLVELVVRLERFGKIYSSLSSLHTVGLVGLVAWVGYQRLFGAGIFSRVNIGLETRYFTNRLDSWQIVVPCVVMLLLVAVSTWVINSLFRGFDSTGVTQRAIKPLSAWLLPPQPSKFGTFLVTTWRVMASDHETTLPNLLIIGAIIVSMILVRVHTFSLAVGLVIYSIYNVLFLLLFSGWAISVRGRLGTSRRVAYALPLKSRQFMVTLGTIVILSILVLYIFVELLLMIIAGHMVGETLPNIAKNSGMLAAVAALTFALGATSYAGQKNKLNQVPVAVGFAVVNILGLVLLAWVNGKYGTVGLATTAIVCLVAAIAVSVRYEEGHLLDEG